MIVEIAADLHRCLHAAADVELTAIELFENPEVVAEAKAERERRVGSDFVYESLVGDRPPPLDYRKPASP